MCITAGILAVSLLTTAVGTVASISSAKANAAMQKMQIDAQNKQIRQQQELARLQASEAEIARLDEFNRMRAANLASIAGSGVSQNQSYLQGISAAEDRALRLDLRNIRLGLGMGESRIADQIRVNAVSRQVVGINATNQIIGAVASGIGGVANSVQFYNTYKPPSGAVSSSSVSSSPSSPSVYNSPNTSRINIGS